MRGKKFPHDRLVAMISDLKDRGLHVVQTDVTRFVYYGAGKCRAPVIREIYARPSPSHRDLRKEFISAVKEIWPDSVVTKGLDQRPAVSRTIIVRAGPRVAVHQRTKVPLTLELHVKCRRCDSCRRLRAMNWTLRAKFETMVASRTWFGTLTLRPEAHVVMTSRARVHLATQGIDFDSLPFGEQFTERHRQISCEITKYLKRVRKLSRARFRYLLVAEHHKSGLPHYHLLLHESINGGVVKHAVLSAQWQLGFEKWRIVDDIKQATYLCKYLSKATCARVRASMSYGEGAITTKSAQGVVSYGVEKVHPELKTPHTVSSEARNENTTTTPLFLVSNLGQKTDGGH